MPMLERYLTRTYARGVALAFLVLVLAATLMEFLEKSRVLMGEKANAGEVMVFLACRVVDQVGMLLPLALVLGVGLAHAYLGRGLELRALAAAGVGPQRLLPAVLIVAGVLTAADLAVCEFAIPAALSKQLELERKLGWTDRAWRFFVDRHWFLGERSGRIFRLEGRSRDGRRIRKAELWRLDEHFALLERELAEHLSWNGKGWQARRVETWCFEDGRLVSHERASKRRLDWGESPERFRPLRGRPRQKSLAELLRTARLLEQRGTSAVSYRLELHLRLAFPLLGVLLVLLAFPWQVKPFRRRSVAGALLDTVLLVAATWLVVAASTVAVSSGLLTPALGGWLPVLLAALLAVASWLVQDRGIAGGHSA